MCCLRLRRIRFRFLIQTLDPEQWHSPQAGHCRRKALRHHHHLHCNQNCQIGKYCTCINKTNRLTFISLIRDKQKNELLYVLYILRANAACASSHHVPFDAREAGPIVSPLSTTSSADNRVTTTITPPHSFHLIHSFHCYLHWSICLHVRVKNIQKIRIIKLKFFKFNEQSKIPVLKTKHTKHM